MLILIFSVWRRNGNITIQSFKIEYFNTYVYLQKYLSGWGTIILTFDWRLFQSKLADFATERIFLFYSCYILDVITCMISIVYLNNGYLIVDLDILDETYSTYRYFDILLSLQISQCVLENKFIKCVVEVMLIQNRSFWNTAMLTFGTSFIIIRYIP